MKQFTKRICAAMTGITMLMTGMCIPQYTATALDLSDFESYPDSNLPEMEPNYLLKTVEGDLSAGDPTLTLSGEELQGETYDLLFAKVYFQPAEKNNVPEGTERLATHALIELSISRVEPGFPGGPDTPFIPGPASIISEVTCCELQREHEYALTAVKKINGFDPETDSLELSVSFLKDDEETTPCEVNCGNYAVQLYGFNYNRLPDEAYLTEIASTEYDLRSSSQENYLEVTDNDIADKLYTNYYVKAEYTVDRAVSGGAYQQPEYASFENYCTNYSYSMEPGTDDPPTPPTRVSTINNSLSRYSDWVRKLDNNHYSVIFSLNESMQFLGLERPDWLDTISPLLEMKLSCSFYNKADDPESDALDAGTVKLTLYGYDPCDLPSPDDMVKVASVKGELPDNVRLEGVTEPLSLDSYLPDNYYLTCAVSKYRGAEPTVAGVAIRVIRDLIGMTGEKKENVEANLVALPVSLENGFGAVKIDPDQLPLQAGDKVEISVAVFDSEGNALSDEECNIVLYSHNEDGLDAMPDVSKLTLLGEATTELSEETVAASVEIDCEQLYKTGFTDYYAVAEYSEPDDLFSNDHGEDSEETEQTPATIRAFSFGTEQMTVVYIELGGAAMETPDGELIETPPSKISTSTMTFSSREVKAIDNASFISLGRPEIGTGSIKVTAVGLTGDTQATSGNLTVKVYGYNRYEMPDYANMDELLLTASDFFSGNNSIIYNAEYPALWIQTRHNVQIHDGESYKLIVTHADGSGTETPLEWNMINGTRIAKIDPAEIGLSLGDKLTIERQEGDLTYTQADADKDLGWQIAVYGEKAADPALKLGDVDCSGSVDVADAVLLARFLVEDRTANIKTQGIANADVNKSGQPDMDDITMILKYIARLITKF